MLLKEPTRNIDVKHQSKTTSEWQWNITQHSFSTNKRFYMGQNIAEYWLAEFFYGSGAMVPLTAQLNWFLADSENLAAAAKFDGSGVYYTALKQRKISWHRQQLVWTDTAQYGTMITNDTTRLCIHTPQITTTHDAHLSTIIRLPHYLAFSSAFTGSLYLSVTPKFYAKVLHQTLNPTAELWCKTLSRITFGVKPRF